jgi:predicted small lipoprotein YifL
VIGLREVKMRKMLMMAALFTALALAGPMACGKRGSLQAPEEPAKYPRSYPAT